MYEKDIVLPQLRANEKFPKAISDYIITTNLKDLTGDGFYLLADIFKSSSFKEITTEPFIKALFDGLGIITDEDNFNAIVKILTQINFNSEKDNNLFIKIFLNHENSRIFTECLLRILNTYEGHDKEVMYIVLKCFMNIMDAKKSCEMYTSDLESFINLAISNLESTYTEEVRYYFLSVLERITKYDDYCTKSKYKLDLLLELLESYIDSEHVEESNKLISKQIIENIQYAQQ